MGVCIIMMTIDAFIRQSLELNVFFLRIMKEHAYFIAGAFPLKYAHMISEAKAFNSQFHDLLSEAIDISEGVIDIRNDMVTKDTMDAEKKTAALSGSPIDTILTVTEISRIGRRLFQQTDPNLDARVKNLNAKAMIAVRNFIRYMSGIIEAVKACKAFSFNYPLMTDHLRREALEYASQLAMYQNREVPQTVPELAAAEVFWNNIMKEHAEFIRGKLDPSEKTLMNSADVFSKQFEQLINKSVLAAKNNTLVPKVTDESRKKTEALRDFKIQTTEGILACKISSVILPLLADHVTREANHFLYLMGE